MCRKPDSNRHEVTLTAPSRLRVYQFHHFGIILDKHSEIKLFFKYTPHQCGTTVGLKNILRANNYERSSNYYIAPFKTTECGNTLNNSLKKIGFFYFTNFTLRKALI